MHHFYLSVEVKIHYRKMKIQDTRKTGVRAVDKVHVSYNNLKESSKNTYLSYELLALPKGPPVHLLPSKHDGT